MRDEAGPTARAMLLSVRGRRAAAAPDAGGHLPRADRRSRRTTRRDARTLIAPNDHLHRRRSPLANPTADHLDHRPTGSCPTTGCCPTAPSVTNGGNQIATPLPQDISPGEHGRRHRPGEDPDHRRPGQQAHRLRAAAGTCATRPTGQWLSATAGIAPLEQNVPRSRSPPPTSSAWRSSTPTRARTPAPARRVDEQPVRRQHRLVVQRVHQPVARACRPSSGWPTTRWTPPTPSPGTAGRCRPRR